MNGAIRMTGSGFHDGPPSVSRSSRVSSRPQTSQAHGSYPRPERTSQAEHAEQEARGDHDEQARALGLAGWEAGRVHAWAA